MSDTKNNPGRDRQAGVDGLWSLTDPYEYFMGRWSRRVAPEFIRWLAPSPGLKWLDVGCGSGALSQAIVTACHPAEVTAVDRSEDFVRDTQRRLGDVVRCEVGDALALPVADASVDYVVSGLVLNFIPEPLRALAEMKRVSRPDGTVAVYVWDYSGKMEFLTLFWEAAVEVDSAAGDLQEAYRFRNFRVEMLRELFTASGFHGIESAPIEIQTEFRDFDDYWKPFLGGQGPAPSYLMSLAESRREMIRSRLADRLPVRGDGSIALSSRAWAIKGESNRSVKQ